jgi:uncharacterized membrane protein
MKKLRKILAIVGLVLLVAVLLATALNPTADMVFIFILVATICVCAFMCLYA